MDFMLWSVAVMVFAVCAFIVFCLFAGALQGSKKRREKDSTEARKRNQEKKRGFRQMGN